MQQKSVGSILGFKIDPRTHLPSDEVVDTTCLVGVELEYEDCPVSDGFKVGNKHWLIEHDDSLRGQSPVEFVLSLPLRGQDLVDAISYVCNYLVAEDVVPVSSGRTSTHIHLDAALLSLEQLKKWVVLYLIFERSLYKYAGKTREQSCYCIPLYKAHEQCGVLSTLNDDMIDNYEFLNVGESYRYGGLNLAAVKKYGSLEFRMLGAKYRKKDILEWINILQSIRAYAIDTDLSLSTLYNHLYEHTEIEFAKEVFGEYFDALNYPEMDIDIMKGIRFSREFLREEDVMAFWDTVPLAHSIGLTVNMPWAKEKGSEKKAKTKKPSKKPSLHDQLKTNLGSVDYESWKQIYNPTDHWSAGLADALKVPGVSAVPHNEISDEVFADMMTDIHSITSNDVDKMSSAQVSAYIEAMHDTDF